MKTKAPTQVELTKQLKQKTIQLAQAKRELLIQKKVNVVCRFYSQAGTFNRWRLSRDYITSCFVFADKWKFLAGPEKAVDLTDYTIARIHSETDFRAYMITKEWDNTCSFGLVQLNDKCIYYIGEILDNNYPELRSKNIKSDPEKNISGGMMWIKHRKEVGKEWNYLRPSAKNLYNLLQAVK